MEPENLRSKLVGGARVNSQCLTGAFKGDGERRRITGPMYRNGARTHAHTHTHTLSLSLTHIRIHIDTQTHSH